MRRLLFVLCFASLAFIPSLAQDYDVSSEVNGTLARPGSDQKFVARSMDLMNVELAFSGIALTKSTNPDVQQFAKRVIAETKTEAGWIIPSANFYKLKAPGALTGKAATQAGQLKAASPPDFDQMYLDAYLRVHHADIENLMSLADHPRGSPLADRAEAQLQIAQRRGDAANALEKKLKTKK